MQKPALPLLAARSIASVGACNIGSTSLTPLFSLPSRHSQRLTALAPGLADWTGSQLDGLIQIVAGGPPEPVRTST